LVPLSLQRTYCTCFKGNQVKLYIVWLIGENLMKRLHGRADKTIDTDVGFAAGGL
jgi:hypothetical protein